MLPINILFYFLVSANFANHESDQQVISNHTIVNNIVSRQDYVKGYLKKFDFAPIWNNDMDFLGFKGKNYQRLRLKFLEIKKSNINSDMYYVSGKTKFKEKFHTFSGTIRIVSAIGQENVEHMYYGVDNEYENEGSKMQGSIKAAYVLAEDPQYKDAGIFAGTLSTDWYIDRYGNLQYDDIGPTSDSYSNNSFVGTWQSYHTGLKEVCNWGHYRIPDSGDFDWGAGEFSPNDKYLKYGWQSYRDAYYTDSDDADAYANYKQAIELEQNKWWEEGAS